MIQIQGISKKFNGFTALHQLSIHVKKGEFYSLLGPNGAGKTTCINIASNMVKASSGSLLISGFDSNSQSQEVKKKIGIVPQEIALYEDLTAVENLNFWGRINQVKSDVLKVKVDETLQFLDLFEHRNKKIGSFSGGMKRRINIAAALLHDPEVLFMDEPTVGIDPQSRLFIYKIFEKLHQQGKTIFYTSHNMEEVELLSDRIGIIDHGELIAEGSLEELKEQQNLEETLHLQFINEDHCSRARHLLDNKFNFFEKKDELFISSQNVNKDLTGLLQIFDKNQIELNSIEIQKVNLEMIFLKLTGKKLRD